MWHILCFQGTVASRHIQEVLVRCVCIGSSKRWYPVGESEVTEVLTVPNIRVAFAEAVPCEQSRAYLRLKYGLENIVRDFETAVKLEQDPITAFTRSMQLTLSSGCCIKVNFESIRLHGKLRLQYAADCAVPMSGKSLAIWTYCRPNMTACNNLACSYPCVPFTQHRNLFLNSSEFVCISQGKA